MNLSVKSSSYCVAYFLYTARYSTNENNQLDVKSLQKLVLSGVLKLSSTHSMRNYI